MVAGDFQEHAASGGITPWAYCLFVFEKTFQILNVAPLFSFTRGHSL